MRENSIKKVPFYYHILVVLFLLSAFGLLLNSYISECDRYGLTLFRHRVFIEKIYYELTYEDGSKKKHRPSKKFAGERNISLNKKRYWWGVGCVRSEMQSYLKYYYDKIYKEENDPSLASVSVEFSYRINSNPEKIVERYTFPTSE